MTISLRKSTSFAAVVALCLAGLLAEARGAVRYLLVIDAGSSGSRMHVYKVLPSQPGALPQIAIPDPTFRVTPGLSSYASDPQRAGESLQPLLDFARSNVPRADCATTPVLLMGTAGLRLLDDATRSAILDSCRRKLARSPFKFSQPDGARVISGEHEGLFAWLAVNYALGTLAPAPPPRSALGRRAAQPAAGGPPRPPVGVLEMGGASTQVTFQPELRIPDAFAVDVGLTDVPQAQLFTHSFLSYGADEARQRAMRPRMNPDGQSPCLPPGYVSPSGLRGTGDYEGCRKIALEILREDVTPCGYSRCSIGNVPHLGLVGNFLATEVFAYTVQMLGLPPDARLDAVAAGAESLCASRWDALRERWGDQPPDEPLKYCFSAAFVVAFLHDILGIGLAEQRVVFSNEVETPGGARVAVGWTLGAALYEVADRAHFPPIAQAAPDRAAGVADAAAAIAAAGVAAQPRKAATAREVADPPRAASGSPAPPSQLQQPPDAVDGARRGVLWVLAWSLSAIAAALYCTRLCFPSIYQTMCAHCGYRQARVFFDLERGAYVQDLSERMKSVVSGMTDAVKSGMSSARMVSSRSLSLLGTQSSSSMKHVRSFRTIV